MYQGFKVEIYPTKEQEKILFYYCSICHKVWNFLVSKYRNGFPEFKQHHIIGYSSKDIMQDIDVCDVPERLIVGVVFVYLETIRRYYSGTNGKPKLHKYRYNKQWFCIASRIWQYHGGNMYFPRVGKGKPNRTLKIDSEYLCKNHITNIIEPHFNFKNGKWYLCGTYKCEDTPRQNLDKVIGLDWGIKNFMTTSEGEYINYPSSIQREFQRISKLKSILSHKQKGSKNYSDLYVKIIKAYNKMDNLKKNFVHQSTTKLCKHSNVAIENLTNAKIRMSTKNIRRLQITSPLSLYTNILKCKTEKYGTELYIVNPYNTSKRCSCCGNVKEILTLKDRIYKCERCGYIENRDVNAAINIAAMAICGSHQNS